LFGSNVFLPPADNISFDNQRLFATGNAFFNQAWTVAPASTTARDGLGPLFNARSCSTCHFKDGRGRPPLDEETELGSMLLRIGIAGAEAGSAPLPDPTYGDQLQPYGIDGVPGEGAPRVSYTTIPGQYADGEAYELIAPAYTIEAPSHGAFAADLLISPRVAPAMIGLGLLEAIPDSRLQELADSDDDDGDGISGRTNRVWDVESADFAIGRFGWKAEQPSVRQQAAGAFVGDLGITSTLFPAEDCTAPEVECQNAERGGSPEIDDRLLERVTRYSELLAVPARLAYEEPDVLRGKARFRELGCQSCHVPSHQTRADAEVAEVADQLIWPYTDLLLHDMGPGLADNLGEGEATGAEWRTTPLWGIGLSACVTGGVTGDFQKQVCSPSESYLHDGRARTLEEAILWHGGEGEKSRAAYVALPEADKTALIAFLKTL